MLGAAFGESVGVLLGGCVGSGVWHSKKLIKLMAPDDGKHTLACKMSLESAKSIAVLFTIQRPLFPTSGGLLKS